jgi:PAS domain S-box-containing protein
MLSLRLKMLGLVAGTVGAAAVMTSAAAIRSQLMSGYGILERAACARGTKAGVALRDALRTGDHDTIKAALEAELPEVGAIGATAVVGRQVVKAGGPGSSACAPPAPMPWQNQLAHHLVEAVAWTATPPELTVPVVGSAEGELGRVYFDLDLSAVEAEATRSALDSMIVGASVVTLAIAVAFAGIGRITVPLGRIRSAASAIAQGNLSMRLEGEGEREVDDLCRQFNEMTDILASQASTARFLGSVMDSMADSLVVMDTDAKVLSVNRAAADLLGYQEAELKGRTASLFCEADGHPMTAPQLETFLGTTVKEDHEVTFISKDGKRIPISLTGSPIKDENGKATGYVCIGTDISARRSAEFERDKMNRQLLVSSREAGMAVVATGVLHNVGNVLNSVNVSASMVENGLKKSKVPTLVELADLIKANKGDLPSFLTRDERGRVIPDYLGKLAQHMASEQERLLSEISSLTRHVSHIKDIISVQQSSATAAGLVEPLDLRATIEDAILVIAPSATRHHAQVVREFAEVPLVTTDRHKLLQIVVNLLGNAIDAVKEVSAIRTGLITVALRLEGPDRVAIAVTDNGIGIAPDNLTRIFAHGFTTKKGGHGFGLHSSALAAAELKGTLKVHSDGPRTGATFTVELPIVAPAEQTTSGEAAP